MPPYRLDQAVNRTTDRSFRSKESDLMNLPHLTLGQNQSVESSVGLQRQSFLSRSPPWRLSQKIASYSRDISLICASATVTQPSLQSPTRCNLGRRQHAGDRTTSAVSRRVRLLCYC